MGAGICTSETMVGAAIGSRTAPKGCAVLAQPYVLQKQWWGAAMGSRTAPKGCAVLAQPYVLQKQWWGAAMGSRTGAGLRHTGLYGCWHMYFRNNGGGRHRV